MTDADKGVKLVTQFVTLSGANTKVYRLPAKDGHVHFFESTTPAGHFATSAVFVPNASFVAVLEDAPTRPTAAVTKPATTVDAPATKKGKK